MPFLLAEILNFQGSTHQYGVGSFSYLILTIKDNGVGFPDSLLQDIENYTPPFSIGNEHIGLKNLLSRFYYFYDGNAFIHLCNPKTGGACAEVKIPIEL